MRREVGLIGRHLWRGGLTIRGVDQSVRNLAEVHLSELRDLGDRLGSIETEIHEIAVGNRAEYIRERKEGRRFAALALSALLLGCLVTFESVQAFQLPRAPLRDGDVTPGVHSGSAGALGLELDFTGNMASWIVTFPPADAGKSYMVLINGLAVLDHISVSPNALVRDTHYNFMQGSPTPLQIITGTVPNGAGTSTSLACGLWQSGGGSQIEITGTLRERAEARNWAAAARMFPSGDSPRGQDIANLIGKGVSAPLGFIGVPLNVCTSFRTPSGYTAISGTPASDFNIADSTWKGSAVVNPTITYQRDSTLSIANSGIVAAGVSFSLFAGFLCSAITWLFRFRRRTRKR